MQRRLCRTRIEVWFLAVAAASAVALVQCGVPDATGRHRTSFPVTVRGVNTADATTSVGWRLTFERAAVALGPVRWYEGEPLFGRVFRRVWPRAWSGIGVAHAHPGHYVAGEALADITEQRVVDLLVRAGVELRPADGVTGDANSATVELRAPSATLGPSGAALLPSGGTLWVRGVAQRGAETVRFEGGLSLDVAVTGIPARGPIAADGTTRWALAVDVAAWLDRADFSTLPPPASADGYAVIPESSQVHNALYRGATSGGAYRFTPHDDASDP
jgi:hypothetical protein